MNIPANGRIAVIDDKIEQALPLLNVLSQNQRPYTYFSGDYRFLPKVGQSTNDIRVLFLDINLIDNQSHSDKVLKGKLIPVIGRIISETNFPYVVVYWSRHEDEHGDLVREIFLNDLKNRKPVGFLSAKKLNFFDLDGNPTADFSEQVSTLFESVNNLLEQDIAHSYLLQWENEAHRAADATLQTVFNSYHGYSSWTDNANFLINKLSESYSGRANYKVSSASERIKNSFQAFNNVFFDTLEYTTKNLAVADHGDLSVDMAMVVKDAIYSVNKKLLISEEKEPTDYSGAVTEDTNPRSDKVFESLLNNCFNRKHVEETIDKTDKSAEEIKKLTDKASSSKRKEIRSTWKKVYLVVTPLCDYVQSKSHYIRVVKGMLIDAQHLEYIDQKSEAIFVSPRFDLHGKSHVLVLNYRYFFTAQMAKGFKGLNPLFRVRQQLLAEIQSQLARHVNRQGILFIDEY